MKKIVVLAGDGIGPEIMTSGLRVLEAAAKSRNFQYSLKIQLFGGAAIDKTGEPLPQETLQACKEADAILLGAIGGPAWVSAPVTPEAGLLALRKELGLYANIRPIRVHDSLLKLSPVKEAIVKGTDFMIVRELTGGIYFGEKKLSENEASDVSYYRRFEIERILKKAFELARTRGKKVLSVDKANVLATSKLWRKTAERVALDFPDCTLTHQYVDSAAMKIIQEPTAFDVIVTENLFGDILSDEAAVLPGTLGVLPSASHNDAGIFLYEPIHGSAPDIAGKNLANPISMILSISLMLRQSFAENRLAEQIENACYQAIEAGITTPDLGGTSSTDEVCSAIIKNLGGK